METDIITYLPSEVIDQILLRLPIRDAVRTSVLSRTWRYKWTTLRDLVFDDQFFLEALRYGSSNKLARIIDSVLLLHSGSIKTFMISQHKFFDGDDIDRWAFQFSTSSVNEFVVFESDTNRCYNGTRDSIIPSSLLACRSLVHLELSHCCFPKIPSTFQGFRNLESLRLSCVTLVPGMLERLISGCTLLKWLKLSRLGGFTHLKFDVFNIHAPLLEWLTLWRFGGFTHLNIDAPNLRYLYVDGNFKNLCFKNTSHLANVSIRLGGDFDNDQGTSRGRSSNLLKFMDHLPSLRRLNVEDHFLKYLAVGIVPLELLVPCIDLRCLSIHLNFNDSKQTLAALCLLRSSPNLQELEIVVHKETLVGTQDYCLEDYDWSCPFTQLRFVMIDAILIMKPELDLIKFLLKNSPALERMIVLPGRSDIQRRLELNDLLVKNF